MKYSEIVWSFMKYLAEMCYTSVADFNFPTKRQSMQAPPPPQHSLKALYTQIVCGHIKYRVKIGVASYELYSKTVWPHMKLSGKDVFHISWQLQFPHKLSKM